MGAQDVGRLPLSAAMDGAPIGVAVFSGDAEFLYLNEALAAINGQPIGTHLGRRAGDVLGPDSEPWLALVRRVFDEGRLIGPVQLGSGDGRRSFEATYHPADAGGERYVVALVQEVTAEAGTRRRLEAIAKTTERLAASASVEEIGAALEPAVALSFVDRISFAVVEGPAVRTVALFGYPEAFAAEWRDRRTGLSGADPVSEAVASGDTVVVGGGAEFDRRYPAFAELRSSVGDEETVTAPILVDGEAAAVLHVTATIPGRLGPEEVETTRTMAALIGLALTRVRAAEQLQRDEFRRALNAMVDNVTMCSAVRDDEGRIVDFRMDFVKDDMEDRFGRTGPQVIGKRVLESYPNWLDSGVFDRFCHVVETGEPLLEERLEYADRDLHGRLVEGTWRVQVVRFGDGFLSSSRDLTEEVAAERELATARQERFVERASLRLLQQMAIPTALPSVPGVDVAADFRAADTEVPLGGDWYDALTVGDDRVVFVIGDVAGHDRNAATNMIRLRNIVNAFAHILPTPGAILSAVATSIPADDTLMATCLIVDYRRSDGRLTMSRAGHPPPILCTAGGTRMWEMPSQVPLGVDGTARYLDHEITVREPTTLFLFSDGLVERRGESLDDGFERLLRRLGTSHYISQPPALCREVVAGVINDPLEDDFCLMAVHLDPASPA